MSKNKKRRHYKLNSNFFLFIGLIILSILVLIYLKPDQNEKTNLKQPIKTEDLITSILSSNKIDNLDADFLNWIAHEYGQKTLIDLKEELTTTDYNKAIWHELTNYSLIVLKEQYNQITPPNSTIKEAKSSDTLISFIGDVSLADNWYIMPKYDERVKKINGILSESVVNTLTSSDIAIANNEFTISDRGSKMPNKYYTFRASHSRLSIYHEMGIDLVTLANNHIYDFGEEAFNDALEALKNHNLPYIGAGKNLDEAKKPYYFYVNGYKIGFVNATRAEKYILTPEATSTTGGVLRCYDPTLFAETIKEAKQNSDYVIALVHWGKEDSHELEDVQLTTSKLYIESGADVIVGSHAHTLQGIDFYQNKAIIYNLGDFIFNNETKDTGIFQLKITSDGELKYFFLPCLEKDEYTKLLDGEEKSRVLQKIQDYSPNIIMTATGEFYPKS